MFARTTLAVCATALVAACSGMSMSSSKPYDQMMLPEAVRVPSGNMVAMETVGVGKITYECRATPNTAGQYGWVFVGPDARLMDRSGKQIGKYYGPPATWENMDGSKLTGTQTALGAMNGTDIPVQVVKANPAMGTGAMTGVTYIQRVATKGGIAPSTACTMANAGAKQIVDYQADYIFYKAM